LRRYDHRKKPLTSPVKVCSISSTSIAWCGQRDNVRITHFHALCGNMPAGGLQVELCPLGSDEFAGADKGKSMSFIAKRVT